MKKAIAALIATTAFLPLPARAGSEFPSYTPVISCTIFGKIPNQVCLDKQSETYALAQDLWREASEETRQSCKDSADQEQKDTPYEALTRCLSLYMGQRRLLVGAKGFRWAEAQK